MSVDEYLRRASLSPWVPTPDAAARRMLQIASAGVDDVHYDLGSGDGRLNFAAIDAPFRVRRSVGLEIDDDLLARARVRRAGRRPEPAHLIFEKADLKPRDDDHDPVDLSDATVVTAYLVEDALRALRPTLRRQLGGTGCRVVTCGYAVDGWEPDWVDNVLGLPLYLYEMRAEREIGPPEIDLSGLGLTPATDESDPRMRDDSEEDWDDNEDEYLRGKMAEDDLERAFDDSEDDEDDDGLSYHTIEKQKRQKWKFEK